MEYSVRKSQIAKIAQNKSKIYFFVIFSQKKLKWFHQI